MKQLFDYSIIQLFDFLRYNAKFCEGGMILLYLDVEPENKIEPKFLILGV